MIQPPKNQLRKSRHHVVEARSDMAWVKHSCCRCETRIASMTLMTGATPWSELAWGYQPIEARHDLPAYGRSTRSMRHRGRTPLRRGRLHPGPDGGLIRLPVESTAMVVEEWSYFVYCLKCGSGQVVEPPAISSVAWYEGPRREVNA